MKKKITIYDIAKKLNVSPGTVSRSLNDHASISKKTKKKVSILAEELGYRTNKFAANLRNQKSNTLGVIVPKLNSHFMSTVLAGIESAANTKGYNLIISQSLESESKEKSNAKTLYDSGVDALLVSLAYETTNYEHFDMFTNRKIPLLFFDRVLDSSNSTTILINNENAGFEATEHLINQGCKHILHISGNLTRNVYRERYLGFKKAIVKNNLPFAKYNIIETELNPLKIDTIIEHIKNSPIEFDGIFVANDTMAVKCIKELQKINYKIPDEIKVIGFNNNPISEIITPSLTTINYPGYEMGIIAGQSIVNHLNGNINLQSANSIILKHDLIIRESTRKSNAL